MGRRILQALIDWVHLFLEISRAEKENKSSLSNMKKKKMMGYILLAVLLVLAVLAVYIYKEYNRTHEDTAMIKPDYSLAATGLIMEFEADEGAG